MLGAWYWFHHNLVAAPGNSVGSKYDVRVVPSPPSTAVERAGKLGVVNQAQSLILCPVLYQFAVRVSRRLAPCRMFVVGKNEYLEHFLQAMQMLNTLVINTNNNNINNFYSALILGGPSSEAQQNKIINHIQDPGTYRGQYDEYDAELFQTCDRPYNSMP